MSQNCHQCYLPIHKCICRPHQESDCEKAEVSPSEPKPGSSYCEHGILQRVCHQCSIGLLTAEDFAGAEAAAPEPCQECGHKRHAPGHCGYSVGAMDTGCECGVASKPGEPREVFSIERWLINRGLHPDECINGESLYDLLEAFGQAIFSGEGVTKPGEPY